MKNKKSPARAKAWDSESFCSYRVSINGENTCCHSTSGNRQR